MVAAYKQLGTSSLTLASTATLKERFIHHAAGLVGMGGSSYIDSVVLRDRDIDDLALWWKTGNGALEERRYYCQNWRADVSVILPSTGCDQSTGPGILEWIKYGAYGVPQAYSMADYNRDGAYVASGADDTAFDADYGGGNMRADTDFGGGVGIEDLLVYYGAAGEAAGRGTMSCASTMNRVGYAGYQYDSVVNLWHVRHRVLNSELGRWTRRDPAGYSEGVDLYEYVRSMPVHSTDPTGLVFEKPCPKTRPNDPRTDPLSPWVLCIDLEGYTTCVNDCVTNYDNMILPVYSVYTSCMLATDALYASCMGSCLSTPRPFWTFACDMRHLGCNGTRSVAQSACEAAYAGARTGLRIYRNQCVSDCRGKFVNTFPHTPGYPYGHGCPWFWTPFEGDYDPDTYLPCRYPPLPVPVVPPGLMPVSPGSGSALY
jgi:RHS repeat-associated protein